MSIRESLEKIYSDQSIIDRKLYRIEELFSHSSFNQANKISLARCPGRISLSKHADYINSDLLYILDDRDVYVAGQKQECLTPEIKLYNSNHNFKDLTIKAFEIDHYLNDKAQWYFYPLKIIQKLNISLDKTIILNISSELPTGSGLSSSHALMLSCYFCILGITGIERLRTWDLIKFCQEVEYQRGFKSGLGDQSAQLLGKKGEFSFIKLFPKLIVDYRAMPENLALITAPSFIKADKSLPEFAAANRNIEKYKNINNLVKDLGVNYLADLIYAKSEDEIFEFINGINDADLKNLALYGLAEAARVRYLKETSFTLESIGGHLNLSHRAEQVSVSILEEIPKLIETEKGDIKPLNLVQQTGYYGASTPENDAIQILALSYEGVYGASISGAGLGGNDLIICHKDYAEQIKENLIKDYYIPKHLEKKARERVHISSSSSNAGLIA